MQQIHQKITDKFHDIPIADISWQNHIVLKTAPEKLLLYGISYSSLYNKLKSLFNENEIFLITDNNDFVPVLLGGKPKVIYQIISESTIQNSKGELIPIRELLVQTTGHDLKKIIAGKEGEYYPIVLAAYNPRLEMDEMRTVLMEDNHFEASFAGTYFSNREMIYQLVIVLMISLALLYFILASQFESLSIPIIVLMEIPIDLFGAFLFLKIFGAGINLMSLIGIIVMCGIVVNDSILKIDTVIQLQKSGYGLLRALSVAGQRRLKPILMTSITTILALVPILFTHGIGSDMQRPLALANIGGMILGTIVSIYFVPLGYYYLNRKNERKI